MGETPSLQFTVGESNAMRKESFAISIGTIFALNAAAVRAVRFDSKCSNLFAGPQFKENLRKTKQKSI